MTNFKNDWTNLLRNIKFRATKSSFQQQLTKDIRTTKNTKTTLRFADKTSNIYKVPKEQCEKLVNMLSRHFTKRLARKHKTRATPKEKNILKNKEVIKEMFVNGKQNCFITLKDHKPNFQNKPTAQILNPAINGLGRISKTV